MATMGIADYSLPEYEGHFRHNALFIGGNVRKAVQEGRADYTPIFLSEIEGLFTSGALADRRLPAAMHAARPLRVHEPGAEHRRFADGGAVRAPRDRGNQRPDAAHAWATRSSTSAASTRSSRRRTR